jgi:hypothetical protein
MTIGALPGPRAARLIDERSDRNDSQTREPPSSVLLEGSRARRKQERRRVRQPATNENT